MVVAGVALALSGCESTVRGAREDTSEVPSETSRAVKNVGEAASEGIQAGAKATEAFAENAGEAMLSAQIKSAIVANPRLNDPNNVIKVETNDSTVTLIGSVKSAKDKATAGDIAQQILKDKNASQKLENNLAVVANDTNE